MSQDTGALFLLRRASLVEENASLHMASSFDVPQARQITRELGGLPLALDQAGAYIEEVPSSLTDYLSLYLTQRSELLKERGGLVNDHPQPVSITWLMCFSKVEEKNPTAADLLRMSAFLAPDAIPEELFLTGSEYLGSRLSLLGSNALSLDKALSELGAYSLIRRNVEEKTFSVHRLVQAVLRDTM